MNLVPKIIHQVWIKGPEIPSEFKKWCNQMAEMNPSFEYKFWENETIERYNLQEEASISTHPAFLANIIRIKILEEFGGIYIDCDVEPLKPLDDIYNRYKNERLVSNASETIVDNGIILAEPGIDYKMFLIDYKPVEPSAFYWQRMKPVVIDPKYYSTDSEYLKNHLANTWVETFKGKGN